MKHYLPLLLNYYFKSNKKSFLSLFFLLVTFNIYGADPNADFTANNLRICIGQSITFTSTSTGTISSYVWNFGSGATPSTATTAGPHNVTYSTGGAKTVTLTVTGPGGTSVKTRTNYITVGFDRIKIISYNLLHYPVTGSGTITADTAFRNPYFRTITSSLDADILVVEEMNSQAGMNGFLSNVMNATSATYAAGTFINGFDTDNGIFYKTSKFSFVANKPITTDLRDINEFKLVHLLTGDTIRIYAVHLKASTGTTNEAQRALEVDSLRKVTNALPLGSYFIVCGDFNFYGSTESAYTKLLQVIPGNEGHFIDPIVMTGIWNNPSYSIYHTQSSRDTAIGDGGSFGGLDDRFDLMLFSKGINTAGGMSYVAGSTTPYGNDGNHYNKSVIQTPTNTSVTANVATALYYASDHIPVFANFDLQLNNCNPIDLGVTALLSPVSPVCPGPGKVMQVRVTNYSTYGADFSLSNLTVNMQVTLPNATVQSFSKVISSGTMAGSSTLDVTFNSVIDMSSPGNYTFNSSTSFAPDINASNNAMSPIVINPGSAGSTTITPSGATTFCNGSSVTLTAASGTNFLWSTGATTQSIIATAAGSYSVSLTDPAGCNATSSPVVVTVQQYYGTYTVFTENIGTVSTTTTIAVHETNNGFQNIPFTMSGTGDVRNTTNSSGYTTASGGANVFLTNTVGKNFIIAGINTVGLTNLTLSFGVYKSTTASNGSELIVEVGTGGVFNTTLTFPPLTTGVANWQYVTASGTIPSLSDLQIQFRQNGITPQFRIDDIKLTYTSDTPRVTALGPTTFCSGGSVQLTTQPANAYLWSNGMTTQTITVNTAGNYSVASTAPSGCSVTSSAIAVTVNSCSQVINLKLYIEGFYLGSGMMKAVSNPATQPLHCDTVTLQLASGTSPYTVLYSQTSILKTDGTVQFTFPSAVSGNSYYLIVRHRNGLETWSAAAVLCSSPAITYLFNDFQTKAYGNRMKNLGDGNFAVYSGDVNQDGSIDMTDYNLISNSCGFFETGYVTRDLTGDSIVESADQSLIENNITVVKSRP